MSDSGNPVDEYLASLPEDRSAALQAVRQTILANLSEGYEEGIQYGMIGYYVPHSVYPAGYHCNPKQPLGFAALGSQKNYMTLHLVCVYSDSELSEWFKDAYQQTGKKLDMGKGCLRFKKLDDLPLEVIGELIRRMPADKWIQINEAFLAERKAAKAKR
jgi:hypothetical protein